ncbi:MAG: aKG-HExxH-type peptide beta-hydroxylase, partial [Sphingobacteriales bacterium]
YDQWEINFSKSIELIEKINPELITCINLLVENILVVYSQDNSHGSMSPKNIIGTVYLPDIEDFTLLAECLIHEALHQYLYRLEHCASLFVENEGIKEIYYSPWKDEPRPLIMVLHGAFVFTGVILYYHQLCEKNIIPDMIEEFKIRLSKRHVQVSVAVEVLLKNNKLTGFGTQIVEIIQENLREVTQSGFLDVSTSMNDVLDHKLKFSGKDYIHANI